MEDYRKIAIELGQTLISKAPETREDVERMLPELREESEDERIKEEIVEHINNMKSLTTNNLRNQQFNSWLTWLEKQGEQKPQRIVSAEAKESMYDKPAWSEEDEKIALSIEQIFNCASLLNIVPDKIEKVRSWLKSLKDRVQPKQECGEEDEKMLKKSIKLFNEFGGDRELGVYTLQEMDCRNCADWLKSLRPQNTWKPSDEQIDALQYVYRNLNPPVTDRLGWNSLKTLELMCQDLKKLREK